MSEYATPEEIKYTVDFGVELFTRFGSEYLRYEEPYNGQTYLRTLGRSVLQPYTELASYDMCSIQCSPAIYFEGRRLMPAILEFDLQTNESTRVAGASYVTLTEDGIGTIREATDATNAILELAEDPERARRAFQLYLAKREIDRIAPDPTVATDKIDIDPDGIALRTDMLSMLRNVTAQAVFL